MSIIDVPALPFGWPQTLPAPAGFDTLRLQWLTEAIKSELLAGALHAKLQEGKLNLDVSRLDSTQTAKAALDAIRGGNGLAAKTRELAKQKTTPQAAKSAFEQWGKQFGSQ